MEFHDTAEEAAFRTEVKEFIQENYSDRMKGIGNDQYMMDELTGDRAVALREWRQALGQRHWITPHWPKEYGGAGMSPVEQFIFNEEMAKVRAPTFGGAGVGMLGPTLILYGTEEQKKAHLPGIASGDITWAQGYSEPGAGSDLASLQTRAVKDGDDYVINGQKIWSSGAHRAQWMFLLARTDPDAPKHRGISMFLMDMKTPGIQIQPLVNMAGDHHFNQEYFDNVRVPATNLVGEPNRGWYVGATLLDFERSGIGSAVGLKMQIEDLVSFVRENKGATVQNVDRLKIELAERRVEAEISALFSYRIISIQKRGQVPNYEASVSKNFRSETSQRLAQTTMKLIGMYGNLWDRSPYAPVNGRYAHQYVASVSGTIAAGTSEINRNVIATRGLGLPRG